MKEDPAAEGFLSSYGQEIMARAMVVRRLLSKALPDVTEQTDSSARMVAYCYGQRYVDMVCTIIPSGKGLKLGFYKGAELDDPHHLLQGRGKMSRYVVIDSEDEAHSPALRQLVKAAYLAYLHRAGH